MLKDTLIKNDHSLRNTQLVGEQCSNLVKDSKAVDRNKALYF